MGQYEPNKKFNDLLFKQFSTGVSSSGGNLLIICNCKARLIAIN